jgi:hypothetical protein
LAPGQFKGRAGATEGVKGETGEYNMEEKDPRCAVNTGVLAVVEGGEGAPNEYTEDAQDCRSFNGEDTGSSKVVKLSIMMEAESTWNFSS